MQRNKVFLILLTLVVFSTQIAPQINPQNATLGSNTSYVISYYTLNYLSPSSQFTLDFSNSQIQVPEGTISGCTISFTSTPYCFCYSNKTCIFKPNTSINGNKKIQILFPGVKNPLYISEQSINAQIYFSPLVNNGGKENYIVVITSNVYVPMPIQINSLVQSDYGVGTYPVTYTMNVTFFYMSKNPQLMIEIPQDISSNQISYEISFNGVVQNVMMLQANNILVFYLQTPEMVDSSGHMLVSLKNMGNPQFLGKSKSFKFSLIQTTAVSTNCPNCKIAMISEGLEVQSTTPGIVEIVSIVSSNPQVGALSNFSINILFYARIEEGGFVKIYFDQSLTIYQPVTCQNVFGFVISNNDAPKCFYHSQDHSITTFNFAYPSIATSANGMIQIKVNNPPDSRKYPTKIETYDNEQRLIGTTKTEFLNNAAPKQLQANVSKNSTSVSSLFTLTVDLKLGQNLKEGDYIENIFPPVPDYQLNNIKCMSAGLDLNCTKTINSMSQLSVTLDPKCANCNQGAQIRYTIGNIMNPSYINEQNNLIYVSVRSSKGVIEGKQATIQLVPSSLQIVSYNQPANLVVGSSTTLQITFYPPKYLVTKGGIIRIQFTESSKYLPPLLQADGSLLGLNYTLTATQDNKSLTTQVLYNNNDNSIKMLDISVCDGNISVCSTSTPITIKIFNMSNGYIPAQDTNDSIQALTLVGEAVALKVLDTSAKAPIKYTASNLEVDFDNAVTVSSSPLSISFTVPNIQYHYAILTLPETVTISGQCSMSMDTLITTQFSCNVTDKHSLQITINFQQIRMMNFSITYNIYITSVSTPSSTQPYTYSLQTYYHNIINAKYSKIHSISIPNPLSIISKASSNTTINEISTYTFELKPQTQQYSSYKIILDKTTVIASSTWASQYNYTFTQNTSHYFYQKNGKISDDGKVQFKVRNSMSTEKKVQVVILLQKGLYKVQRGVIKYSYNDPILLGVQCVSQSLITGAQTSLSCSIDRNNGGFYGQKKIEVKFAQNLFNYSQAEFNGGAFNVTNGITLDVEIGSPQVINFTLTKLINRRFIPASEFISANTLEIKAKTQTNSTIGSSNYLPTSIVPNQAKNLSCTAIRSVTKSGQFTNLTISYTLTLEQMDDVLVINLPEGQNAYFATSSCKYNNGELCTVTNFTTTEITILLDKPTETKLTLHQILNYHINPNLLTLTLLQKSTNYLIEKGSVKITPQIELQQIDTTISSSNSQLNQINELNITVMPVQRTIFSTNFIIIVFPMNYFTRKLSDHIDCTIVRENNMSFTGCQFSFTDGWLTEVRVKSFGHWNIQKNQKLKIIVTVTNGPAPYLFESQTIRIQIKQDSTTYLSEGLAPLAEIYPSLTSFSLVSYNPLTSLITQSSLIASSLNSLTVKFILFGNLHTGSQIVFMVPKDSYKLVENTTVLREDTSYFYLSKDVVCGSAQICSNYTFEQIFTLINGDYVKNQRNPFMIYGMYDSKTVTQTFSVLVDIYSPRSLMNFSIARNSSIANQNVNIELAFTLQETNSTQNTFVEISSQMLSPYSTISFFLENQNNTTKTIQPTLTSNNYKFQLPNQFITSSLIKLILKGKNNMMVSRTGQMVYTIKIFTSSHILFANNSLVFAQNLTCISSGIKLQRALSEVTKMTDLYISINLPLYTNFPYSSFIITANGQQYGAIQYNRGEYQLNTYTNPDFIDNQPGYSVNLCNASHCIYNNTKLSIMPALTARQLDSGDIDIQVEEKMYVHSLHYLTVTAKTKLQRERYIVSMPKSIVNNISHVQMSDNNTVLSQSQITVISQQKQDNLILTFTPSTTNNNNNSKLTFTKIKIYFYTPDYQIILNFAQFTFTYERPTSTYIKTCPINIYGEQIQFVLSQTSYKIRQINNYTLRIVPLEREGVVLVRISEEVSKKFLGLNLNDSRDDTFAENVVVNVDGMRVREGEGQFNYSVKYSAESKQFIISVHTVDEDSLTLEIMINSVENPTDNRPIVFKVQQHQTNDSNKIFAYSQNTTKMTQLDQIHIYEGERNSSKILDPIQIAFKVNIPPSIQGENYKLTLKLASTQVIVNNELCTCTAQKEGENASQLLVQSENQSNSIIIEGVVAGNWTYTVVGCLENSQFSEKPENTQKIYAAIGQPYQIAETTTETSVVITPFTTTGLLGLSNMESLSSKRLTYTTLWMTIHPENPSSCNGIIIVFSLHAFWLHTNIQVLLNGQTTDYQILSNQMIFIAVKDVHRAEQIIVTIQKMINYLSSGPMTIFTVKKKTTEEGNANTVQASLSGMYKQQDYGVIDLIRTTSMLSELSTSTPSIRLIIPNRYQSESLKHIILMIDSSLPLEFPKQNLYVRIQSSMSGCSRDNLEYATKIEFRCELSAGDDNYLTMLFMDRSENVKLAEVSKHFKVYSGTKDVCNNVLCDKCSDDGNGGQYCFECREGMFSSNGKCVQNCPSSQFSYQNQHCVDCSPDCSECFELDSSSCLACSDPSLLLDSGTCRQLCTTGTPYNSKWCVSGDQCTTMQGCRICSQQEFCYQCLPDFQGQPTSCTFFDSLPPNLFIFIILPWLVLTIILMSYQCIRQRSLKGCNGLFYYMFSVIEFLSCIFLIARVRELEVGIIICALLLLKVIISIVAYETYYLKKLPEYMQLSEEEESLGENKQIKDNKQKEKEENGSNNKQNEGESNDSCKMKLIKFTAHFLACQSYELLSTYIGQPQGKNIEHHTWYMRFNMANRFLLLILAIVAISQVVTASDLLWLSLCVIISGTLITLCRILQSQLISTCYSKLRGR